MMHRMKMTLQSKTEYGNGYYTLEFSCVYDQSIPEDQRFCAATPSGNLKYSVSKAVADAYDIGKYYYFDSCKVE